MPATINITFRTEPEKRDELDQLAKSLDRDRSYLLNQAVEQYLELHRWQIEQVEKGIADIKVGRFKSLDEVRAKFRGKAVEDRSRR
jgi:predicted transcriptional regulator